MKTSINWPSKMLFCLVTSFTGEAQSNRSYWSDDNNIIDKLYQALGMQGAAKTNTVFHTFTQPKDHNNLSNKNQN